MSSLPSSGSFRSTPSWEWLKKGVLEQWFSPGATFGNCILRNLFIAAIVLLFCAPAYLLTGYGADPSAARTLALPVDRAIPFIPWTILLYAWAYTFMLYPVFVVRDARLILRVAAAYAFIFGVAITVFTFFPVTSIGLRPELDTIDSSTLVGWAICFNFYLDPPYNLFPSLHVSIAVIAALSAWQARRAHGLLGFVLAAAIGVSVLTVKQHYLLDALAGVALALVAWRIFLHPHGKSSAPVERRALPWQGPLLYLVAHTLVFALLVFPWFLGFEPWNH